MQHAFSNYLILNMCAVCACTCTRFRTRLSFCSRVCVPVRVCAFVCVRDFWLRCVSVSSRRKLLDTETRDGFFIFPLSAGPDSLYALNKQRTKSVRLTAGSQNQFLFQRVPL